MLCQRRDAHVQVALRGGKVGDALRLVTGLTVLGFIVTGFLIIAGGEGGRAVIFNGGFIVDDFAALMKLLVLLGTGLAAVLSVQ